MGDKVDLDQVLKDAHLPALMAALVHLTGETSWLRREWSPTYNPLVRDDIGLQEEVKDRIRGEAKAAIERFLAGTPPQMAEPDGATLRRMIDRFDPAAIEEELKSNSAIGNLLSGGRNAKLWELYQKRHRDIAQSAESSFLGEIGADFRDAYEEE